VKTVDRIMLLAPNNPIPRFSVQSAVLSSKKKKEDQNFMAVHSSRTSAKRSELLYLWPSLENTVQSAVLSSKRKKEDQNVSTGKLEREKSHLARMCVRTCEPSSKLPILLRKRCPQAGPFPWPTSSRSPWPPRGHDDDLDR
jgi:hypothetical protein